MFDLKEKCCSELAKCDDDLKVRQQLYSDKKSELSKIIREETGSLMNRDLTEALSNCKRDNFKDTD